MQNEEIFTSEDAKQLKKTIGEVEEAQKQVPGVSIFLNPEKTTQPIQESLPGKDSSKQSVKESVTEFIDIIDKIVLKMSFDFNVITHDDLLEKLVTLYSQFLRFKMIFEVVVYIENGEPKDQSFYDKYKLLNKELIGSIEKDNVCNKYVQLIIAFMRNYFEHKVMPLLDEAIKAPKNDVSNFVAQADLLVVYFKRRTKL